MVNLYGAEIVGKNINGQATHGARKHAWRTQAAWANRAGSTRTLKSAKKNVLGWPD